MVSERMQRQIDRLLDDAEVAAQQRDWSVMLARAQAVLDLDPANADARGYVTVAQRSLGAAATESSPATNVKAHASTDGIAEHAQAATSPVPESFVSGRYHVRRFLGEGGKKKVFLAHDELLNRDIAFALIKSEGLDEAGRQRIAREAQAMGSLGAHPNIVSIFDIGEHDGQPYLVQELMAGGDVEALIASADGALPLARSLRIATEVARGLAFAHAQGIVHRDLKPGNVWLTASTPDGIAKIGDFGLAVNLARSRLTTHGLMVGTYHYMPPEQALGGEVTPRSDLYSLGAMLYELVTGKAPFQGDSPTAVISQHINTRPVAPSWHTEHCPPALVQCLNPSGCLSFVLVSESAEHRAADDWA